MERLSPMDASFLHLEDGGAPMHIGAVAVVEGPAPDRATVMRLVASKLPQIPRYRQTVRVPALTLGRPVWVDDPGFELHYHVRFTTVAPPGGDDELRGLIARLMTSRLDRSRPLWELSVVEGLAGGRWALVAKAHHAMVDGVAGIDLLGVLLDDAPDARRAAPERWRPERQPSGGELAVRALAHRALSPAERVRAVAGALAAPRTAAMRGLATLQGFGALAGIVRPVPATSLNGPVGPQRHWDWARVSLADVRSIRAALGGTVNDVVLAATAAGLRELLLARGESCARPLRTMVPMSLRRADERGRFDNRVTAMFADLPVDAADPLARFVRVRREMRHLKGVHEALGTELFLGAYHLMPAALLARGLRAAAHREQRFVATVATNVPGPQSTLFAAGRRVIELLPYVPIAENVRTGIAILSYDGRLAFGITGDGDDPDDLGVFTAAVERDLADLAAHARAPARPPEAVRA